MKCPFWKGFGIKMLNFVDLIGLCLVVNKANLKHMMNSDENQ